MFAEDGGGGGATLELTGGGGGAGDATGAGGTGGRTCAVAGEMTGIGGTGVAILPMLPVVLHPFFFFLTASTMTMIMMIGKARMSKPMTIAATMKPGL